MIVKIASWTAPLSGLPGTLSRGHGMELAAYIVKPILSWVDRYRTIPLDPSGITLTTS